MKFMIGADMNEIEFKRHFGKCLCTIRKNKKLTQEKLAELIGLDPQYYCKMENGNHFPSVKTIIKISKVLEIEVGELFGFKYEENELINKINSKVMDFSNKELLVLLQFIDSVIKLRE